MNYEVNLTKIHHLCEPVAIYSLKSILKKISNITCINENLIKLWFILALLRYYFI